MLISIHVPKTAGTSFRNSLAREFGDRLLWAYGTRPLSSFFADRVTRLKYKFKVLKDKEKLARDYDAIHGHFVGHLYDRLPVPKQYCLFLRDPLSRVVSHYVYCMQGDESRETWRHSLWSHVVRNRLDIYSFAALPEMRNLYGIFLGKKRIEEFDFVGLTEEYAVSLQLFEKIFGIPMDEEKVNVAKPTNNERFLPSSLDRGLLAKTQEKNRDIYDRGRRRFEQLCRRYL